ncbi:MAG TPA: protease pro-enzyme activation domain-containing protein [Bryobacteraceae bacterium]|nr:protease pro-enzyme activation domain-containing protein [Bryobacteraceae bacterium]
MKYHRFRDSYLVLLAATVSCTVPAVAQVASQPVHEVDLSSLRPKDRITAVIDDRATVVRPGNRPPLARPEFDRGGAPPERRLERMMLLLEPDPGQQQALEALLAAQHDPRSPQYQQWLTPETFGQLFGASDHDIDEITAWLSGHGFDLESIPPSRRTITFSGTVREVEQAFHTEIHTYEVSGQLHYANASDPQIPAVLAPVIHGVVSMNDFYSAPQHLGLERRHPAAPEYTSGSTHYIAPADFATIYDVAALYSASTDGTGQSIAVAGRTNINVSDITTFRSTFGLPAKNPTIVVNGPNPGIVSSDEQAEANLDVEWSGAVAKNAEIKFVISASTTASDGVALSSQYIVNNNLAPVISVSFGLCEAAMGASQNQFWNSLWQQAAAQGMVVLVASGDDGAAGCDQSTASNATGGRAINGICSTPYSTCVGGTQFADSSSSNLYWLPTTLPTTDASALSYIPEIVWNESGAAGGTGLWAGGGGVSAVYAKPSWQTGAGVPTDGRRDVPDVALTSASHDGYLICLNGGFYSVGGTSAATPSFAGLMALVAQRTNARVGNASPALYTLAANQTNMGVSIFHDVTSGSNSVPGVTGYSAAAGYDLATGLGSVDAFQLVNHWSNSTVPPPSSPSFQLTASANSATVIQGASAALTLTVTTSGGFNSAVVFSAGAMPSGATASFTPAKLHAPGSGSTNLTLKATAQTPPGTYNLTFSATGGGITKTVTVAFTVQTKCSYTVSPANTTAPALGGQFVATVKTGSGCVWNAVSGSSWIAVKGNGAGDGSGSVRVSVAVNASLSGRSGSVTIAGQTVHVQQSGVLSR